MFRTHILSLLAAFCITAAIRTPAVRAQTFSNSASINLPTSSSDGRATLYPSAISVSRAPASIGSISVTLDRLSHEYVSDVNVLLVSPGGQKILLMANATDFGSASNNILTFIPDGTATLPFDGEDVVSGVYACSVYENAEIRSLPSPAPPQPYGTSLVTLIGTNANGIWNLYVWDDFAGSDNGALAGGWSITFSDLPFTTAFTYQGRLSSGGAPIDGDANVRFTLCSSPTAPLELSSIGSPITKNLTGILSGQITTSLDFGAAIDWSPARWLNIEVESPPGSGFVTLAPRQAITPTPQARIAQRAVLADNATNATNATNAASATTVPWSGITGVPDNIANGFTPWISTASGISYPQGTIGIGTSTPTARMELSVAAGDGLYVRTANESPWALRIGNDIATTAGFQTGMYVTNNGFFRITNRVANPNGTYAQLGANGAWTALSDERLKVDVTPAEGNLAAALKLRPVNFRWKADGAEDFGLIAQEVREVLPRLVTGDESKDSLTLNYSQVSVVAIGAIQEQQREIDRIKAEAARHAAENADLKARLERLEKALDQKTAGK